MLKILSLATMAVAAFAAKFDDEINLVDFAGLDLKAAFGEWKLAYNREYATVAEEFERFTNFIDNLQTIAGHNSDREHGSKSRINQFGDMSKQEYLDYVHRGFKNMPADVLSLRDARQHTDSDGANPTSVDWTTQGVVTPVKNQGQCGSCWAFSATGSTECRVAISTGTLNSLSEQQLVDCSHPEGNLGCDGGEMDAAFKYIEREGGLCTEKEYPYKARGGSCEASTCGTLYDPISSYTDVQTDSESSLETATVSGCVSVAIEADQSAFQFYSSGILTGNCGTNLDHGVLVVGYGVEGSQKYWKVKNSWGESWGEQGYVRICKDCNKNGSKGECGINMDPSFPVSKD